MVGPTIAGIGFALLALPSTGGSYWLTVFPGVTVLGFGMAIAVAPLTTTVMSSVEFAYAGTASGVNNAASRVAALLAVALFGIVMAVGFNSNFDRALAQAQLPPAAVEAIRSQREKLAAIDLPAQLDAKSRETAKDAIAHTFVSGYRWIMLISALLGIASAVIAWLTIDGSRPRKRQGIRRSSPSRRSRSEACCGVGLRPEVLSSFAVCGYSTTGSVARIDRVTARFCTREAMFTVCPK